MTIKAVLIPFDEDKPVEVIDFDNSSYENYYPLVAPDSRCFTVLGASGYDMFGDDEGLLRADAGDRINARAMELYAAGAGVGVTIQDFHSPLVGDWLVVGSEEGPMDQEKVTDVPQEVIDFTYSWTTKPRV